MVVRAILKYNRLSSEIEEKIIKDRENGVLNPFKCCDSMAFRRDNSHDKPNLWRPPFVRDCEKIMHLPSYNRYADKTQVFSFYNNDDISRRSLHVQLVSRIARNIGAVLGLNLDLIEAIALGHDLGHTPFGHAGERYLSELTYLEGGIYFNHNVQSLRVLDSIYQRNVTFQTLDGIISHNGEIEMREYRPDYGKTFEQLDREVRACLKDGVSAIKAMTPATLEGCVVRISDMIAYLGKDRQDAKIAHIIDDSVSFETDIIGTENAAIINNLTVDIIENSYGKDYICMSEKVFCDLRTAKQENYEKIYNNPRVNNEYEGIIKPMFADIFYALLSDLRGGKTDSVIFSHHIDHIAKNNKPYGRAYEGENPVQIVADFISAMTDDYFLALHKKLFPESEKRVEYRSYF